MYRITSVSTSEVIGLVDEPLYVKISSEGNFVPTTEADALGVAFKSIPYALQDKKLPKKHGFVDTVTLSQFNGGEYIAEQQSVLDNMVLAMLS